MRGDLLVSNFNSSSNFPGTGITIVQITPAGNRTLFAHIDSDHLPGTWTGGVGLITALVVTSRLRTTVSAILRNPSFTPLSRDQLRTTRSARHFCPGHKTFSK